MTDDEGLMLAIQAGDAKAYEAAIRKYLKSISHFAFRMLGNSKDTEDITQETFLRLWTHADSWQSDKASVSTWLHRITHNLCIDYLRKDKSSISSEYEDKHEGSDRPADAPTAAVRPAGGPLLPSSDGTGTSAGESAYEVAMLRRQAAAALRQALEGLPERQRTAIVLSHYQGFSNKEVALIMDISVDALESILARARRSLKAQLKQ